MKLKFPRHIFEKKKIRQMGAELFHADRRTDMTKLIVGFHNLAIALRKDYFLIQH